MEKVEAAINARATTELPGRLIAVEGLDGSGKSTQIHLLKRWFELRGLKQKEYGFDVINGNRSIRSVANEIRAKVEGLLEL